MRKFFGIALLSSVILATPAAAQLEVSLYMGSQSLPHSRLKGDIAGTPVDRLVAWEGKSLAPPPYYGARAIYWQDSGWGYGAEFTHAKAVASSSDRAALGLDRLEFTDGHNIITANIHHRWQDRWWDGRLTPFVTAGLGVAVPHVDIRPTGGAHTHGYQLSGAAIRLGAGVSMKVAENISAYTEYQFTYSNNTVALEGGGTLKSALKTNAINAGLSYQF